MDLRQLRYFLAAAEHRHFTRAAEASFVSQPALSQQILGLERELGTPLFDRLSTGAELTTAGRVLRDYAERILREVDNAKAAVEEVANRVRGELSVATVHTANLALVVEALARFRREHPDVSVRIHEERSAEVVESVLSGRVNLGVTYLPVGHDVLETTPLYEEELVLVVPAGHELVEGAAVEPEELADLPLIVPPEGFCLRVGIDGALGARARGARIVAEISSIESICAAVRAGLGVTLLPRAYVERPEGVDGLVSVPLAGAAPRRSVGAVRRADRHLCLATRAFLASLESGRGGAGARRPPGTGRALAAKRSRSARPVRS
ncbi:MAG TPA: LysR substrate-binding domain-containing protein [Longimicrobiales bacterium]|nr:LysR substrate-binding domain-containing protein [Longimicrobiales bacterium]